MKFTFQTAGCLLAATVVVGNVLAEPVDLEHPLDFALVARGGPLPTPVFTEDLVDEEASPVKRAACAAQVTGAGPVPSPDTDSAFVSYSAFSSAALAAPTPTGYVNTFTNLNAENNALGYLGYTLLNSYDVNLCASKCNAITGCAAINVAFERAPSQDPSVAGGACPQPKSTTLIKCVFWGGPVDTANANNYGQYRNQFHVVVAGSNGYVNATIANAPGYTGPNYLGGKAIVAPYDCNNRDTLVANEYWNDGKFLVSRCAAACSAQTAIESTAPCYFFDTYIISENGKSLGQYCSMYSQAWSNQNATLSTVQHDGATYQISYSYTFTNATHSGLPCIPASQTLATCASPGECGSYPQCNPGQDCYCGTDVNDSPICFQDTYCFQTTSCLTNNDCTSGNVCLSQDSCCGFGICVPNAICKNTLNARDIFRKRDPNMLSATRKPRDESAAAAAAAVEET